jgi:hypothetical protein
MADGQATQDAPAPAGGAADAPGTLDDLAQFLADNPDIEDQPREDSPRRKESVSTDTPPRDGQDTPDDDAAPAPDAEDDDDPDANLLDKVEKEDDDKDAKDQTSERKFKVTIKGDDGADEVREVPESELIKGYMRQSDYSRKRASDESRTTEFAQRTLTALEGQRTKHTEQLTFYAKAVQRLAAIRSPEEMATLAQTDPAQWVAEQQREKLIQGELNRLQSDINAEKAEAQRITAATQQAAFQKAWGVLGQQGIDKPKLRKIFDDVGAAYGFTEEQFQNITNPSLVLMMRDAAAYKALKEKSAAVTKKVQEAPRMPPPRQTLPRNERLAKRIDARFKGGHAKLDDLAAYLAINKL